MSVYKSMSTDGVVLLSSIAGLRVDWPVPVFYSLNPANTDPLVLWPVKNDQNAPSLTFFSDPTSSSYTDQLVFRRWQDWEEGSPAWLEG